MQVLWLKSLQDWIGVKGIMVLIREEGSCAMVIQRVNIRISIF